MPERRMIIVLSSLLAAMTLTSGLLLLLEPAPAGPLPDLSLRAVDRSRSGEEILFATRQPLDRGRWDAIVIHDSGTRGGSSRTLDALHEQQGRGGLGYHFVIGNGQGAEDGLIEVGYRWDRQIQGLHSAQEDLNQRAISICLVGNGDNQPFTEAQLQTLLWVVRTMQRQFDIPADRVVLDVNRRQGVGVGPMFPIARFRPQLLNPAVR